jgi:hypothetical protein
MKVRAPVAVLLFLLSARAAHAQPVPTINAPAPLSIQRGQSADITLAGSALATVSSVALPDDSGLKVTLAKPTDAEAKLKVEAASDAPPGMRELRLVSPTGVSNPVQIWVEQYPLIADRAPNTDPTNPQPISLPAIVTGTIEAPGDSDCYRFTALKGQQLVFNVIASRTRSPLDANLLIYDVSTGRELVSNNDTFGADPFIGFVAPEDGQYTLEIRDIQYRGAKEFAYRIEAGAIPFVQALSPMSSRRGTVV